MRELNKASSLWVHEEIGLRGFAWQDGYVAFTVSATSRVAVREYIIDQEEHHRSRSFREEMVAMLRKAGVERGCDSLRGLLLCRLIRGWRCA